ncbi:hypothetical protein KM043_010688 [Ampulex compressa]|nr:hypothetical protein KM043_010688 [Ampulex compressa]
MFSAAAVRRCKINWRYIKFYLIVCSPDSTAFTHVRITRARWNARKAEIHKGDEWFGLLESSQVYGGPCVFVNPGNCCWLIVICPRCWDNCR